MADVKAKKDRKKPVIRVSYNEMEAFMMLPMLEEDDEPYTLEEIYAAIDRAGVKSGLKTDLLEQIVKDQSCGYEHLIAEGEEAVDGIDGYFEYNFNTDLNRRPTIRPDGSVDYWSIHLVEIVEEGQVVAMYHEPIQGSNGMSVKGKLRKAKRGRPLPPLKGKGFNRSEDNLVYTSQMDGKIDMKNGRINIVPVYEVYGNADLSTGNIDFNGDVIVHGNVTTGVSIKAQGSVTVDGVVEASSIEANTDIVLRGGVLGKKRGKVMAKGCIYAKFFEYVNVEACGFIEADSFLDCNVYCEDEIKLNGKKGSIIGGRIEAIKGITANCLGNDSYKKTAVQVGMGIELLKRVNNAENELQEVQSIVDKLTEGIKQFDELGKEKNIDVKKDERRVALVRAKIAKTADLNVSKEKVEYVHKLLEKAKGADIKITKKVYPGSTVSIDSLVIVVKDEQNGVNFVINEENNLVMYPL
ncbi:FapA family protein [Lachnobacterium bovis]|uniref:Flagellar Assembly Protein A N-terminal region domain-containing protein n=1 Tax=Lachnobacterium bovis DSM 14045 TaxID=1122142 RepID=A0A1H3JJE6_9FIRM|nr:FapA family protein [Lachnobacterium bovis]SDY39344.1 hypothetical protein SAMN02910414_01464 [Lachnobacterium bovis DSM 14045]